MTNLRRAAIAAIAALALLTISPPNYANSTSGWVLATSFDQQQSVVTGITKYWQTERLKHGLGTLHQFIDNPDFLPPGQCRSIGIVWNLFVFQNRPRSWFDKLLRESAKRNCSISYVRVDAPNADGTYTLISVRPSK